MPPYTSLVSGFSLHLYWLVTAACAVASVFMVNSIVSDPDSSRRWVWLFQSITPIVTVNMLGNIVPVIHAGESLTVVAACSSILSVPILFILYGLLLFMGKTVGVFWIALLAKISLWVLGHYLIWKGQKDVAAKNKKRYSRVEMENVGGV